MIGLIIFIILIILIIKIIGLKIPFFIGRSGEKFVSRRLNKLNPNHYKILNDVLLPSKGNLNSTQIDHIVVSNYGIFSIETKSYSGWIFGNANDEYWTQVIYRNKTRFYSPLRQNYAHVKAIEELIKYKYSNLNIIPLVIFPDAEKLKISNTNLVGYTRDIVEKIKSYDKLIITDSEKEEIYNILLNADIKDKELRKKHNREVRELKE